MLFAFPKERKLITYHPLAPFPCSSHGSLGSLGTFRVYRRPYEGGKFCENLQLAVSHFASVICFLAKYNGLFVFRSERGCSLITLHCISNSPTLRYFHSSILDFHFNRHTLPVGGGSGNVLRYITIYCTSSC